MRQLRAGWLRIVGIFAGRRRAERFDAELESHIELHVEENISRGMTPAEARRQALVALGGVQTVREAYRDRGGIPAFDTLAQDVRFAARMLRKAPGFTATAVLILALGIGANAAVFSLINAALIRPLNGGTLDAELVGVYGGDRTRPDAFLPFSYAQYVELRDRNDVFTGLLGESGVRAGVTEGERTRRVDAMLVSSNYFSTLNVPMAAGRAFTREEENPLGDAAVAVVSHAFWRQHGLEPGIVGRPIVVNGRELTIVGVAPDWFHGTMAVMSSDLWMPFGAARLLRARAGRATQTPAPTEPELGLLLAATLKPGVSAQAAAARLAPLADALAAAYPEQNRSLRIVVQSRSRTGRSAAPRSDVGAARGATVLMAVAGMVLSVACLNLANMLLARGGARRQEIAVRLALGGSRYRIIRQLVVEGILLAILAAAAALAISWWAAERFVASLRSLMPITIALDVSPDIRVVLTVVVASIVSTLIFSLGPAWRLSKPELAMALKPAAPAAPIHATRLPLPSLLVGAQIALSLTLLVAAGVFMRSSGRAAAVEPGFPLRGGLIAALDAGLIGFDEPAVREVYAAVLTRVRTLPGVADATLASIVPFGNDSEGRLVRRNPNQGDDTPMFATLTVIGARYFSTLGLPVIAGREFTEAEGRDAKAPIAVIDRLFAERVFGTADPIGQIVHTMNWDGSPAESLQIVGVVPTVRDDVMEAPDRAHLYVPFGSHYRPQMTLHARVDAETEPQMIARLREAIRNVDARLPIVSLRTLKQHRDASLSLWGVIFASRLFAAFGTIALILASVGVYGLRAYLVTRRTREIGIRVALGATRQRVVGQLLREGARIAAAGLLTGLVLAVGVVQLLRGSGMLVDTGIADPLVFTMAALVLAIATTAASYIPARRALRIDPAVALRPE